MKNSYNSSRVRWAFLALLVGFALMLSEVPAHSQSTSPFYHARLEPPGGRVLNGWGQFSSEWNKGETPGAGDMASLEAYRRAVSPNRPALLSFYTALDSSTSQEFASRYKEFVARQGFFVSQIGVSFQSFQRDVSQGIRDPEVIMLLDTIREAGNPMLMRIGCEFNNPSALYDPSLYILSFRGIVGRIREAHLDSVATVWNPTAAGFDGSSFMRWYPGDDVVDWWGVSLFDIKDFDNQQLSEFLERARSHGKPVIISEAAPVFQSGSPGRVRGPKSGAEAAAWYRRLATLLNDHPEIQGVVVISVDWRKVKATPPGVEWPDLRIGQWPGAVAMWKKELSDKRFINADSAATIYHGSR